jgi:hypothetical protein
MQTREAPSTGAAVKARRSRWSIAVPTVPASVPTQGGGTGMRCQRCWCGSCRATAWPRREWHERQGLRRERPRKAYQVRQQPQPAGKGPHRMSADQTSWDAAVRHLYRDALGYIATGPRRHEDWTLDVLALMARAVPDHRGWARIDDAEKDPESMGNPHPSLRRPPPPEYVRPTRRSSRSVERRCPRPGAGTTL